ncbi:hypothetical protein EDB83DRAFT_2528870 [Lactarius deliciosus]|nr:hypothetical protein EDB83DRAFT_2528870 [Lactarius deliciosus]
MAAVVFASPSSFRLEHTPVPSSLPFASVINTISGTTSPLMPSAPHIAITPVAPVSVDSAEAEGRRHMEQLLTPPDDFDILLLYLFH